MKFGVNLNDKEVEHFLKSIHLEIAPPSFNFLCKIIVSTLANVPFQNIFMLLREKKSPSLELIKADMLSLKGGPCGHINPFLGSLFESLGFEVSLVPVSMMQPNCHLGLLLTYNTKLYYIDCGDGKPYFQPIPISENASYNSPSHKWKSYFKQNHLFIEYQNKAGIWFRNCQISLQKVNFSFFDKEIHAHYTQNNYGPFQTGLRLAVYPEKRLLALRDDTFTYIQGNKEVTKRIENYSQLKKIHSEYLIKYIHFDNLVNAYSTLIENDFIDKKILA